MKNVIPTVNVLNPVNATQKRWVWAVSMRPDKDVNVETAIDPNTDDAKSFIKLL